MIKTKIAEILLYLLDKLTNPPETIEEEPITEPTEQMYIEEVAYTIEDAYFGLPGFKSVVPQDNCVCVYLTDSTLFNFFPKRFMDVPVKFVFNGIVVDCFDEDGYPKW